MSYAAVIFDLDGTLIDSLGDLADSMNDVLRSLGHPTHPRASYRRFVGDGMVNLVRRSLPPAAAGDFSVEEALRQMRDAYRRRWLDTTVPYNGIPELLSELRALELRTAVLSNKPEAAACELVHRLFPEHPFDRVRGASPDIPLKPDPTAAFMILSEIDVQPRDALYLGDTNTDMQTGRRAGMFTVGVTWGFRDEGELRSSGAQSIIHHPLELLHVVRHPENEGDGG